MTYYLCDYSFQRQKNTGLHAELITQEKRDRQTSPTGITLFFAFFSFEIGIKRNPSDKKPSQLTVSERHSPYNK